MKPRFLVRSKAKLRRLKIHKLLYRVGIGIAVACLVLVIGLFSSDLWSGGNEATRSENGKKIVVEVVVKLTGLSNKGNSYIAFDGDKLFEIDESGEGRKYLKLEANSNYLLTLKSLQNDQALSNFELKTPLFHEAQVVTRFIYEFNQDSVLDSIIRDKAFSSKLVDAQSGNDIKNEQAKPTAAQTSMSKNNEKMSQDSSLNKSDLTQATNKKTDNTIKKANTTKVSKKEE